MDFYYTYIVLQKFEENPKFRETGITSSPVLSSVSTPVAPITSISPLLTAQPSEKAMDMTTAELCEWLKEIKIPDKYIEYFKEMEIDGLELAAYTDEILEKMGISEPHIRIRILVKFQKIS